MAQLTQQEKKVVAAFKNIQQTLFPSGKIPSMNEVRSRIEAGTHTVADSFIADMYNKGVPSEPILSELDETKDFYNQFEKVFSKEVTGPAPNTQGISSRINTISKKVDLNSSFDEFKSFSLTDESGISESYRRTNVDPLYQSTQNVLNKKLARTGAAKGTRKLAKGAIPPEVLQSVLEGIGDIPDPVTRDAVMASLLGYRGEDLSGMRTSRELAIRSKPVRPYYDRELGIARDPEVAEGGGRKAKGPDKPPGPVLREILNRRFDAAGETGELFPGMTTGKITAALKKHVFPKIPKKVLDQLLTAPSGYTDLRRITASAIANQLGRPDLASEIISHKGGGEALIDKVMTGYYIDVEDIGGLQQRGQILTAYEKMMADAVGAADAKGLGEALRLDLPAEFNAEYPEVEALARPSGAPVETRAATPEEIAQGEQLRAAKTAEATATAELSAQEKAQAAEAKLLERAKQAPEIAAAQQELAKAKSQAARKSSIEVGKSYLSDAIETFGKPITKGTGKVLKVVFPPAAVGLSAVAAEQTYSAVSQQAQAMGLPSGAAKTLGTIAGATEFLPVTPSDVVTAGQALSEVSPSVTSPRPVERVMADQPELFSQPTPQPTGPVNIPEPVATDQGQLAAEGFVEKRNLARRAAMQGEETPMAQSFLYGGIVR
jgi:hypothetical protein